MRVAPWYLAKGARGEVGGTDATATATGWKGMSMSLGNSGMF